MRLKLFRAASMAEAMARVRAELGADALILAHAAGRRRRGDHRGVGARRPAAADRHLRRLTTRCGWPPCAFHGVPDRLHAALRSGALDAALAATLPFGTLPLEPKTGRCCSSGRPAPARR